MERDTKDRLKEISNRIRELKSEIKELHNEFAEFNEMSPGNVVKVTISENEAEELRDLFQKSKFHIDFEEVKEILGDKLSEVENRDLVWLDIGKRKTGPDMVMYVYEKSVKGNLRRLVSFRDLGKGSKRFPVSMYVREGPHEFLVWKYGTDLEKKHRLGEEGVWEEEEP